MTAEDRNEIVIYIDGGIGFRGNVMTDHEGRLVFLLSLGDEYKFIAQLQEVVAQRDEGLRRMMRSWWKQEDGK